MFFIGSRIHTWCDTKSYLYTNLRLKKKKMRNIFDYIRENLGFAIDDLIIFINQLVYFIIR